MAKRKRRNNKRINNKSNVLPFVVKERVARGNTMTFLSKTLLIVITLVLLLTLFENTIIN